MKQGIPIKQVIAALCVLAMGLLTAGAARAFWSYGIFADHQDITKTGLSAPVSFSFSGASYSFSATAIDQINEMHAQADDSVNYWANNHFDSDTLVGSLTQMAYRRKQLMMLLSPGFPSEAGNATTAQVKAWKMLGWMLHAAEDFYSHSNWVDQGNNSPVNFGLLTKLTSYPPTPPSSFILPDQGNYCESPPGYPLLASDRQLVTGYYPPAVTPAGACIHGDLVMIGSSCLERVESFGIVFVPGISHDIPCAYLSNANDLHVAAKGLAIQEVTSLLQSIVADLAAAKNSAGFCLLLGLDGNLPLCDQYAIAVNVTGLPTGKSVLLSDNGTDMLTVSANGVVSSFTQLLASGSAYSVAIVTQPTGATCTLTPPAGGTVGTANITVAVTCQANSGGGGTAPASMVSAGDEFACALAAGGSVSCWGSGGEGELGNGANPAESSDTPVAVTGLPGAATAITTGGYHACALSGGAAWCWGWNLYGELGNGMVNSGATATPVPVTGLTAGVISISAGLYHSCAVTSAGTVMCWGYNSSGQLGTSSTTSYSSTPLPVAGLSGVIAVSASWSYTCALTSAGTVWCWGSNNNALFGTGTTRSSSSVPVPVYNSTGSAPLTGIIAIATGPYSACGITNTGAALCWGDDTYGELGDHELGNGYPGVVSGLSSGVTSISVGDQYACASTSAGTPLCWGTSYALGNSNGAEMVPVAITGIPSGVTGIAAGYGSACATTSAGNLWCWGGNTYGELGDGSKTASPTPVEVMGLGP